jgi:thymidylate kinase
VGEEEDCRGRSPTRPPVRCRVAVAARNLEPGWRKNFSNLPEYLTIRPSLAVNGEAASSLTVPASDSRPPAVRGLLELLDATVSDSVVVFGALPPEGRDLDLLARPGEERSVAAALSTVGFVERGQQWVRFGPYAAEGVDIVPASHWQLPEPALDDLFADGTLIDGLARLVSPSAHHALLILARQLSEGGRLHEKRRLRLIRMLAQTPDAFERAREHAPAWGAERALDLLERMYREGATAAPISARASALVERLVSTGVAPRRARLYVWRSLVLSRLRRRRQRGAVVAISGLDGAGKTTQAHSLHCALTLLRIDSAVAWTRITSNSWIWVLALGVEKLLALASVGRRRGREAGAAAGPYHRTTLRRRSRVVTEVWSTLVALANALSHRRAVARHLREGRVVICDRYVLDSAAHLRYRYGESTKFGFQLGLIRKLSPEPVRSFFLDVAPERAHDRRHDEYTLDELTRLARLYRSAYEEHGVRRIDSDRPLEDVCAEIGRDVWLALR